MSLGAIDIQRGRDHGLADYNTMRSAYGLDPVTSFDQITSDSALQDSLQELYGDINDIDPLVGALAEDHLDGASVGPLTAAVMTEQFTRLRDVDRFWFENDDEFSPAEIETLQHTRLSDIIRRNTDIRNIQDNVFIVPEPSTWWLLLGALGCATLLPTGLRRHSRCTRKTKSKTHTLTFDTVYHGQICGHDNDRSETYFSALHVSAKLIMGENMISGAVRHLRRAVSEVLSEARPYSDARDQRPRCIHALSLLSSLESLLETALIVSSLRTKMKDMHKAPQQDWVGYDALTRAMELRRLRSLGPRERFSIYADLYRLISDGRRSGDWARLDAWRWQQKIALRQRLVDAYRGLDQQSSERSASHDTA